MSPTRLLSVLVLFAQLLVFPVSLTLAQEAELTSETETTLADREKVQTAPFASSSTGAPAGAVSCFDYYRFGSVQVDLSPTLEQTVPGAPLTFSGTLKNENPYPIVDGSVYVKIFKTGEENFQYNNGYPLVAFFEAGNDLQLPSNSETSFSFDWVVPSALSGGEYEASFFFVTSDRFNLLGLSFTDDVTGNKASFKITADEIRQVVFNKHTVTLNDKPYSFAAYPPRLDIDTPAVINAELINPDKVEKTITIDWQLYNWDGLREDFLLDTKTETVVLKAGETKTVSYTASKLIGTVSYIIATAHDGDATSIINPRFARNNIEEVRLNFPSLLSFPLIKDQENTIFSCVHSTNIPLVDDNMLTMTLTDANTNEVIHTYTYQGGVTSAMMGVADKFTPTDSYGHVILTTTLKKNGATIDTVSQTYDCSVLSPENCPETSIEDAADYKGTTSIIILTLIFVGIIIYFRLYNRKQPPINITNPTK